MKRTSQSTRNQCSINSFLEKVNRMRKRIILKVNFQPEYMDITSCTEEKLRAISEGRRRWRGRVCLGRCHRMSCQDPVRLGEFCHPGSQEGFKSNEMYHHL